MSEIIKIGITKNHNQEIIDVTEIDLVAGKGIIRDRHFKDYKDPFNQLSIIESEFIDEYNFKNKVPYCTNMSTAQACLQAIKSLKTKKLEVTSLQEI